MINFHKVTSLPGQLEVNSFYFVENGNYAESYVTDDAGVAKSVGNSAMINALIASQLSTFDGGGIKDYADIPARDADQPNLDKNTMCMVYDASADSEVSGSSAMYYYDNSADTFTLVADYESLNISLDWNTLINKPLSTVDQIDSAVSNSHSHSNKSVLDDLSDSSGVLQYKGSSIGGTIDFVTNNW